MSRYVRISLVFCVLLLGVVPIFSQGLKTAGTSFTFAIPEGADRVSPLFTPSQLALIVLSPYDGDGVMYSPSGVEINFTFFANRAVQIEVPYTLMNLTDIGKTNKGIIVKTTQPINLTYYLIQDAASESSQIFPDDVIGTDYLLTGWGLWNDVNEDNRNQIVVIAKENGTDITITPRVGCIGGYSANVPVNVMLNRGELFILKADTSGIPITSSLSNSLVRSSKPVSVMVASTCSYVPLGQQACNPIIDHILPTSLATDTVFYVTPPSAPKHDSRVLFVSETPQFFVVTSSGLVYQTSTGRIVLSITNPDVFTLSAPAICHLLTAGYENYRESDPSLAPVLPIRNWQDTLLWLTPSAGFITNYVSLVYRTADADRILLDQAPINIFPTQQQLAGTQYSIMTTEMAVGEHKLTSPSPVMSMISGFASAEAMLSLTTGIAPPIPKPVQRELLISSDTAKTCRTFTSNVSLIEPVLVSENIYQFRLTFTYDSKLMVPTMITPLSSIASISTIESSLPGTISLIIRSSTPLSLSGELLTITFDVFKVPPQQTVLRASSAESELDFGYLPYRHGVGQETIQIYESRGVVDAKLSIVLRSVGLADTTSGQLYLETTMADTLSELRVRVRYDHDVMTIYSVKTTSTVLAGWDVVINKIDDETDEFVYTNPNGAALVKGKGILGFLKAMTYVTDTNATEIALSGFFTSASLCPLDVRALDTTGTFVGIDQCGDEYLHAHMKATTMSIVSVVPLPVKADVSITISHELASSTPIDISLIDMRGTAVWQAERFTNAGPLQDITVSLPPAVVNGSYILTLTSKGQQVSSKIVVAR